jgi:ribosomal protein L22
MTAEDEQEIEPGETPAAPGAEAAKKPARAPKAPAEAKEPEGGEGPAKKPARKKAPAKKPAAEEPTAKAEEPAEGEEPKAKKPAKAKAPKAAADGEEKPSATKPKATPQEEPPAEPAPTARKGTAPVERRATVHARARYVRTSARKARMVCGHLRGKSVQEARAILAFTPRDAARDWSKLLESAVANAENNHELLEDDLIVREAYADEGPTIKRFRPRAMGRATPIRKRTSHLTITLTPRS